MLERSPSEARPFYFSTVVWGERFRNYFLEYCLPSLLAPGNIPALDGRRSAKFLIATTLEDWDAMRATPIFRTLERYAEAVLLELPPSVPGQPNWERSVAGYKLYCGACHRDRAYRIFVVPDYIYSDGTLARTHELAMSGAEAVLINSQPRIIDEEFFAALDAMRLLPKKSARDTGEPLAFSGRQLVAAALRAMHSMTTVNEWESAYFCGYAASPWWRVPGEDGIVIFGITWNPLLIDYAAVVEHDLSAIDLRGLDGDYDMRTIGGFKTIYAIQDSDEAYAASWSTREYQRQATSRRRHVLVELAKGAGFRASFLAPAFNWLHRTMFFVPIRLHTAPLNDKWNAVEEKALATLLTWLEWPSRLEQMGENLPAAAKSYAEILAKLRDCRLPWWRRNPLAWDACRRAFLPLAAYVLHPVIYVAPNSPRLRRLLFAIDMTIHRIALALRGDPIARRWWRWRLRKFAATAVGRPFYEPRPEAPE